MRLPFTSSETVLRLSDQRPAAPPESDCIARLREVSPRWADLHDKFVELVAREEQIAAELAPLTENLRNTRQPHLVELQPRITIAGPSAPAHSPGALEKLGGLVEPPPPPRPFEFPLDPRVAKSHKLGAEIYEIREAIRLLRPELEKAHRAASIELCRLRTPEYRAIADRFCTALIALGDVVLEHQAFAESMKCAAWSFIRPIEATSFGKPTEDHSEFRRLLNWAAETGHFDMSTIPESWRVKR